MYQTLNGVVSKVERESNGKRVVTIRLDKLEGGYTSHSFEVYSDTLGLDQKVAVSVQAVETPLSQPQPEKAQSASVTYPEGYTPQPIP